MPPDEMQLRLATCFGLPMRRRKPMATLGAEERRASRYAGLEAAPGVEERRLINLSCGQTAMKLSLARRTVGLTAGEPPELSQGCVQRLDAKRLRSARRRFRILPRRPGRRDGIAHAGLQPLARRRVPRHDL